jgi:ribonuclease P protein component
VKRRFRLTRSIDLKRVRRSGKSYAHPLIVLYALRSEKQVTRVAVAAGLTVGNAVRRNRAKRLLRAAMGALLPLTAPGFDLMLIARPPLAGANLEQTRLSLSGLLQRARLLSPSNDG